MKGASDHKAVFNVALTVALLFIDGPAIMQTTHGMSEVEKAAFQKSNEAGVTVRPTLCCSKVAVGSAPRAVTWVTRTKTSS
jgi:hypothetical protein